MNITNAKAVDFGKKLELSAEGGTTNEEITYTLTNGTGKAKLEKVGNKYFLVAEQAGDVTLKATMAGDETYLDVESAVEIIKINKIDATGTPVFEEVNIAGVKLNTVTLTDTNMTHKGGVFTWTADPNTIDVEQGKSYEWKYTPNAGDDVNYNAITGSVVLYPNPPAPPIVIPTPEPEKPVVPEVKPDIEKPILPVEPPKEGANIGIDKEQQAKTDQTIKDIVNDIVKPADPEQKHDPEKPQIPQTEAEKETAATEQKIVEATKDKDTTIKVEVKTDKIVEDNAPVEVKKEIAEIKEVVKKNFEEAGTKLLQFVNIDVTAQAVKNGVATELGNLRNLGKELTFTFVIPENTDGKKLAVVRYHDGVAEIIPSTCEGNKIVFKTDKFSTYALVEYDKVATPEPPVDPEKPELEKPAKVEKVKVNTDNGLLKVTFEKVTGVDKYKVYIREVGNKGGWRWYNGNSEDTMIKQLYKKPLVKNGKYQIKVVAVNEAGSSDPSAIKTVYANRIATKSAKMYTPKFNSLTSKNGTAKVVAKKVYVKNTPKNLQYKVSYRLKGTKTWRSVKLNNGYSAKNVKYIKGLKKGKTYTFALRYRYQSSLDNKTYVYSNVVYKTARVR